MWKIGVRLAASYPKPSLLGRPYRPQLATSHPISNVFGWPPLAASHLILSLFRHPLWSSSSQRSTAWLAVCCCYVTLCTAGLARKHRFSCVHLNITPNSCLSFSEQSCLFLRTIQLVSFSQQSTSCLCCNNPITFTMAKYLRSLGTIVRLWLHNWGRDCKWKRLLTSGTNIAWGRVGNPTYIYAQSRCCSSV